MPEREGRIKKSAGALLDKLVRGSNVEVEIDTWKEIQLCLSIANLQQEANIHPNPLLTLARNMLNNTELSSYMRVGTNRNGRYCLVPKQRYSGRVSEPQTVQGVDDSGSKIPVGIHFSVAPYRRMITPVSLFS